VSNDGCCDASKLCHRLANDPPRFAFAIRCDRLEFAGVAAADDECGSALPCNFGKLDDFSQLAFAAEGFGNVKPKQSGSFVDHRIRQHIQGRVGPRLISLKPNLYITKEAIRVGSRYMSPLIAPPIAPGGIIGSFVIASKVIKQPQGSIVPRSGYLA